MSGAMINFDMGNGDSFGALTVVWNGQTLRYVNPPRFVRWDFQAGQLEGGATVDKMTRIDPDWRSDECTADGRSTN